jgi:uncharacterized protein
MASAMYHEPLELMPEPTRDLHRALSSLMEELEAVDWYQQRTDATQDQELRAVLEHNRDEEIEHAMMLLEWLRRKSPVFDKNVRTYLMKEGPITEIEAASGGEAGAAEPGAGADESLGIGSLKGA